MADPKSPLITEIVNHPSPEFDYNLDSQKIPTLFAINQLFSGLSTEKPDGSKPSANEVKVCGVFRFSADRLSDIPAEVTTGGILVVYNERHKKETYNNYAPELGGTAGRTSGYVNKQRVRQVLWPDGPDNITPYTRTYNESATGDKWTQWQTLGGNLRRVKLDSNKTALGNVMYYSFGNYTLTLPDPASFAPGTKVALEQYAGEGTVKWVSGADTYTQNTEPAYQASATGGVTPTVIGPRVYYFETIVENDGTRSWIMDVDNDISLTINDLRDRIGDEAVTRKNADDTETDARIAADALLRRHVNATLGLTVADPPSTSPVDARLKSLENTRVPALENVIRNKGKLAKVYHVSSNVTTSTSFPDGYGTSTALSALLGVVDPTFVVGNSGLTITLPAASAALVGTKVNVEVPNANWTVTVVAGSDSETFTNDTGAILLLPFECELNASGNPIWTLTVIS